MLSNKQAMYGRMIKLCPLLANFAHTVSKTTALALLHSMT